MQTHILKQPHLFRSLVVVSIRKLSQKHTSPLSAVGHYTVHGSLTFL